MTNIRLRFLIPTTIYAILMYGFSYLVFYNSCRLNFIPAIIAKNIVNLYDYIGISRGYEFSLLTIECYKIICSVSIILGILYLFVILYILYRDIFISNIIYKYTKTVYLILYIVLGYAFFRFSFLRDPSDVPNTNICRMLFGNMELSFFQANRAMFGLVLYIFFIILLYKNILIYIKGKRN